MDDDEYEDYDYLYNTPLESPLGPCTPVCDLGEEEEANRLFWEEFGDDIDSCEPMGDSLLAEFMRASDSSFSESFSQTRPSCQLFDDDEDDDGEEEEEEDIVSSLDGWYEKATRRMSMI